MMTLTIGKGRARAGLGTQVGIPHFLMLFSLKISFRWAEWSILLHYTVNEVNSCRIGASDPPTPGPGNRAKDSYRTIFAYCIVMMGGRNLK